MAGVEKKSNVDERLRCLVHISTSNIRRTFSQIIYRHLITFHDPQDTVFCDECEETIEQGLRCEECDMVSARNAPAPHLGVMSNIMKAAFKTFFLNLTTRSIVLPATVSSTRDLIW